MGPYLAQPVKEKVASKAENAKLKLKFARCEMQGTLADLRRLEKSHGGCRNIRAGYRWRQFYLRGVRWSRRYIYRDAGAEVSKYVEKIFVAQLKGCKLYK